MDLVESALGRIGLSARTTIVEPARFTPALLSGEFDGSAAAWKDAERERVLIFSQPYLENRLILVGRRGADVSATSLNQLDGKRVAIVEGYSYGDALDFSGAMLVRSRSDEDSLALLLASKTDYTLMDELVVQYLVDNYPTQVSTRLDIGSKALVTRPLYLAVKRARPDAETIVTRFNAEVRAMIVDRTYHRLLHVSWISADIDGDGDAEFVPASDQSGTSEPRRAYALSTTTGQRTSESPRRQAGLLRRREHLYELGVGAEPIQGRRSVGAGRKPIDCEHFPIHLVTRGLLSRVNTYPARSVSTGLMRAARRAGSQHASRATTRSMSVVSAKIAGSRGLTP